MPADTVLLIVIAVCAIIATVGVVVGVAALLRVLTGLDRTKAQVDSILSQVESETRPTLKEIQSTARGITNLSWTLKQLVGEAVVGVVGRRMLRTSVSTGEPQTQSPANMSALQTGIDTAFRLAELWLTIRAGHKAEEDSSGVGA
jgi:hypothetical protein